MAQLRIELNQVGLHLPDLGLWADAHEPRVGPERVFISHAHSDHVAAHREVILSQATAKLMEARQVNRGFEHVLEFGETRQFEHAGKGFDLTLLPAGHIFGSAMLLIQTDSERVLYTGDFKLRKGMSAEECQPCPADVLIMETTYGRPQYVFPPTEGVIKGVVRFCREALDNGETPVLLGYSLGKSQELLCCLGEVGLPLMLHGTVQKLTKVYEQFGQCFPKYEPYVADAAEGKVLICPPNVINSAMLRKIPRTRTAMITGWAVDPNCRFRYQCDAAFPLSDHADFNDLIKMVKAVNPKRVYTLHGFAADFASTLCRMGHNARALSQDEQLVLPLLQESTGSKIKSNSPTIVVYADEIQQHASELSGAMDSFQDFAATCSQIASTSGKLEKIRFLAEYLLKVKPESVGLAATWFAGRPFAGSQNKALQTGWAVLRDAIGEVAHINDFDFHQVYLKHSDVGETVFELFSNRSIAPTLSLEQVDALFHALWNARGPLSKLPILVKALEMCTAVEGKYLVKIITGDLRIGLKEGLVEEAIARAFEKPADAVRRANLLVGDIGETAKLAGQNRLEQATITPFRPVKLMLASPEETAAGVWGRMHRIESSPNESEPATNPIWLEDKYDGVRCQAHKAGAHVALYSRDLKDITATFQDVADGMRSVSGDFILDGEMLAMRGESVLPFADLQKRLGRREADLFMREEVPISFVTFDLLWMNGESYLARPLTDRRAALERLAAGSRGFRLARITQVNSEEEIEQAFDAARARGNEGLMIKDPKSLYLPGRRGLAWLKLKKALATLDCAVVGAEYGHGKRSKMLSDYTFSVWDENRGQLVIIGKAYSGLTDLEIAELTKHFSAKAIRRHGRYFEVEPDTVLEIAFGKIQESDRHDSGLAMRFPRIVRIRTDKTVKEIDTLATARKLARAGSTT